jgi:hypothetical protein
VIKSDLVGDAHFQDPFCIGRVYASQQFVHVFDEMSLQCVMSEIDTAQDFVEYLSKRAALLTDPNRVIFAPGEEELLASYLIHVDRNEAHSFLQPSEQCEFDDVAFAAGGWNRYVCATVCWRPIAKFS